MVLGPISAALTSFQNLRLELQSQRETFHHRKLKLDRNLGDQLTVWMMDSWSTADSLKRKETEVLDYRKREQNIDIKVTALYEKIVVCQLEKAEHLLCKLSKLAVKSEENDSCPYELSVALFRDWCKTDAHLIGLQSEILELLSQKVRMKRELDANNIQTLSNSGSKEKLLESSFENFDRLRQCSYSVILTEPLIDAEFSIFVNNRLSPDGCQFEARKLRLYVKSCLEFNILHRDLKGIKPNECPYSPSCYQQFMCSLAEHIVYQFKGHLHHNRDQLFCFDHVFTTIESIVYPQLEQCLLHWCNYYANGNHLDTKLAAISHASQSSLGISSDFQDQSVFPYINAIVKLKTITCASTPTLKLKRIVSSARLVMDSMDEIANKLNETSGADQFMDIWVFVISRSNIENIKTITYLLRCYCNPTLKNGEVGYFLASLELATEFLSGMEIPHHQEAAAECENGTRLDHLRRAMTVSEIDLKSLFQTDAKITK